MPVWSRMGRFATQSDRQNASASARPLPKIINPNNKSVLIHISLKVWWTMSENEKGAYSQGVLHQQGCLGYR